MISLLTGLFLVQDLPPQEIKKLIKHCKEMSQKLEKDKKHVDQFTQKLDDLLKEKKNEGKIK